MKRINNRYFLGQKGFSFFELLLGVIVLAIIAAVVVPRVGGDGLYGKLLAYTAAHKFSGDLRLARSTAIMTNDRHRMVLYQEDGSGDYNRYKIQKDSGGAWNDVGEEKKIADDIDTGGDPAIIFNINGSSDRTADFTFTKGGYTYRVNVRNTTGRVKLEQI